MKMNSRRIEFENIKNARDLGGLYTEDGHSPSLTDSIPA